MGRPQKPLVKFHAVAQGDAIHILRRRRWMSEPSVLALVLMACSLNAGRL